MKIGAIILARANFGRWPDKVLFELQGKSILEHVITKAKTLNVDTVIVSTTENQEDQIIRNIAWDQGVQISRGDPDNRTSRICQAITDYDLDYFVDVSPARPFFDAEYENILIQACRDNQNYDVYGLTHFTHNFVPGILNAKVPFRNQDDDQEIYVRHMKSFYCHWEHWEPAIRNRYLFSCNIAYKIQANNQKRICEHLGHFPKNHEELMEALLTIE